MHKIKKPSVRVFLVAIAFVFAITSSGVSSAQTLSNSDIQSIYGDTTFYDPNSSNDCRVASTTLSNKNVYVIGDSYGVGVRDELRKKLNDNGYDKVNFNVATGRSVFGGGADDSPAITALEDDEDVITDAGTIVILLGTNPEDYADTLPRFMKKLNGINDTARKFWVNVGVTRPDLQKNTKDANTAIKQNADEFEYSIVDWNAKVSANAKLISGDKVHPTPAGYTVLSDLIAASLGKQTDETSSKLKVEDGDNAAIIWSYLVGKGLAPYQAAGIMGNMQAESGFEPKKVQYGFKNSRGEISVAGEPSSLDNNVPQYEGGYGLVQWTYESYKVDLRQFANNKNLPAGNLQLQLDFLWKQLTTTHAYVLKGIETSDNITEATRVFLFKFERPEDMESKLDERVKFSEKALKKYGGLGGLTTGCKTDSNAGEFGWEIKKGANSMIYYSQYDPKWADKPFGTGPIWECGCGPTSMAMIAATLNNDTSITPPVVAKYYYEQGGQIGLSAGDGINHCGSKWSWDILAKKYDLKMKAIGIDFSEAEKTLKAGGLVLMSVDRGIFTSGGHLMVIRKVSPDGTSFYLADPLGNQSRTNGESNTKAYTRAELITDGSLKAMWTFTQ